MEVTVTFIGNATTLISGGGVTLLTDPNFLHRGQHAYLGYGLVSKRLREPAIDIDQLPPLEAVVLSHMHGDHWDRRATTELDHELPVLTTPHAAKRLSHRGFGSAFGLQTWQKHNIVKGDTVVNVTALPGRHAPAPIHRMLPPVMGSMLEFQRAQGSAPWRMYVSGDTLVYDDLRDIPKRYPNIDLALLHLGGTKVMGVLVTMDAKQGVEALRIVNPRHAIPIHYNDYEVFKSPLSDFLAAVKQAGLADKVSVLQHGQTHRFTVRPRPQ
jgi:L-ascorbate metabolism protein UlaG (beta-lactamase superfamily)